ncbi:MAG: ABC transporter ATP-binding protein [Gammaproteobacteria bacterium]|nr:ABC transporter ATP-binding protein [Gammaproteobacteria bacterium]
MNATSPAPSPVLRLERLRFDYGDGQLLTFPDCEVPAGQHCLILGPSGCGKSTLLHLIAGLLKPTGGHVELAGQRVDALRGASLDRFRGRHVGLVFQRLHLLPALSVADNLLLAQGLAGMPRNRARVNELLERLGVAHRAHARPDDLSFGQAQRVALARAVINSPPVILADEPTSNLDDGNTQEVLNLLQAEASRSGASLIVATHDRRIRDAFDLRLELAA